MRISPVWAGGGALSVSWEMRASKAIRMKFESKLDPP
jgi:hypothetical protein